MNWPKNFLTYTVSNFLTGMFPIWEHTFKQLLRVCYYSICHFISCFVLKENWKMKWIDINSPAIKILNFCRTRLPPKLDFPIWWDRSYGQSFETVLNFFSHDSYSSGLFLWIQASRLTLCAETLCLMQDL